MILLDKEIIRKKLSVIVENLAALETVRDISIEEYLSNIFERKATERLLQELIEAAIDINMHIIMNSGAAAPDDYYDTFIRAGELKIISFELAEKIAPSAGLRNRLVHEYDELVPSLVVKSVRMAIELYSLYVKAIEAFLAAH